ncbi:neutral zinc metallopeptidase [Phycicoccus sp. 3266]|jgi:predicted metalloprotease|uniref:KPN_02809 family neutral zinc metallopeptidase n=1 Tax=Phycicoccus sp. 3266 TaxID=2817751 RepID=UPI00285E9C2D|nr:neutral zinc metallopeptidase [Phycicoccus sp. 3266]MDR6865054.1 putative metalloprotease [Phycicoccus sp. 3266]
MSFNDDVKLDTSQVGGGGGGGAPGGLVVGGGVGGIILLIIMLIFGINPGSVPSSPGSGSDGGSGSVQPGGSTDPSQFSQCKTGADANRNDTCRVIATVNSVNAFWSTELPRYGRNYTPAKTILYSGSTQSACGTASNQVGPFYCPLDKQVYIDASFFQILSDQFGSSSGPLAQEYVVAHEYGHHIQDILGLLDRAQQDPKGAQSGGVRVELMADCLGGVWANHATETKGESTSGGQVAFLKPLTEQDIKDALSAASSVGDDRIQQKTQGQVSPETWTHGSAAARQKWFTTGYRSGDLNQCDTFSVDKVE